MTVQVPVAMPTRSLGRRGPSVTMLGFGGAPLGDLYAPLDDATAIDTVLAALDAGVRLVDTSPLYGRGLSEHRIGTALRRRNVFAYTDTRDRGQMVARYLLGYSPQHSWRDVLTDPHAS